MDKKFPLLSKYRTFNSDPKSAINCPNCGGNYLYHETVEIYDWAKDATEGLCVVVDDQIVTIEKNPDGNPSSGRHALRIIFSCEHCPQKSDLAILQYEGQTFIEWISTYELMP